MMEFNSHFTNILVEAHQQDLRKAGRPFHIKSEAGAIRKAVGHSFVWLGERIGGTTNAAAPESAAAPLAVTQT